MPIDVKSLLADGELFRRNGANIDGTGVTEFGLFGATTSVRIPMAANPTIDGPAAVASGSDNTVGIALNPKVTGDFTGITGADAGVWWGLNVFAHTGTAASDGSGLTDMIGSLIELAVQKASGTIPVARGLETGVSLFGASAGATITQAESLRVSAPTEKAGATSGSIVTAYGLFVEEVTAGTSANLSLYVDGGVSRFGGRVDVAGTITSITENLDIYANFSAAAGAKLSLYDDGTNSGGIRADLRTSGAALDVYNGTDVKGAIFAAGHLFLDDAASAPSAPADGIHLYTEDSILKYKGTSGNVHVVETGLGFPCSVPPHFRAGVTSIVSSNRRYYMRVTEGGTISKIGLEVGTASGNISVAIYSNTGAGRSAAPGARIATSGSVSCPASGYAEVSLGGSYPVQPGDWISLAADNTTATFQCAFTGVAGSNLPKGVQAKEDSAFTAPATATPTTEAGPTFILVGVA